MQVVFQFHKLLAEIAYYNFGGWLPMNAKDIFWRLFHFSFHSPLQVKVILTALFSFASCVSQSVLQ